MDVHESLAAIDSYAWNKIAPPDSPFHQYEFLYGLEQSGCVGGGTGWRPLYVTVSESNELKAAVAAYLKTDSYGEFIFDWQWASAWQQAGLNYYPKMTIAIPFSPVNVPKFLVSPQIPIENMRSLISALHGKLLELAQNKNCSSIHYLFTAKNETEILESAEMLPRITHQFHWHNRIPNTFTDFDDWLSILKAKRRKEIKRERRKVLDTGLEITRLTGEQIQPADLEIMFEFYLNTHSRKWGSPYLNAAFFEVIYESLRPHTLLVLAKENGKAVAGTLNFFKGEKLYGRYWGASRHYDCLHFELCFYQLIEFAIENKMSILEAGAQGEHKFLRGFDAREIISLHDFFHPQGREAIRSYLERERNGEARYIQELNEQHSQQKAEPIS